MAHLIDPKKIESILISEERIQARIREIGEAISQDYEGKDLALISVLKGAVYFIADLTRHIAAPHAIDFMAIGVYADASEQKSGVRIIKDLDLDISGKHVLMVEDVIDTGLTLSYLLRNLRQREPASLEVCSLLNKKRRRIADMNIKYCAFDLEDEYVVGYGMDHGQLYRNLPFICTLKAE